MAKTKQAQIPRLIDNHGRVVNYLRISLTDRCNLKCIYCHPPQRIDYMDRSEICSYKDLLRVVNTAVGLGIDKIRLTGGELFLRRGFMDLIRSLHELEGLREIGLTTNGTLLLPHLKALKNIGIRRINVSLDTLSENMFYHVTGSRRFASVMEAIHAALQEDLKIKINMVVLKGINDNEIVQFIETFSERGVEVRFIEFMPLCGSRWRKDYFFPYKRIMKAIESRYDLYPVPCSGVAREFTVRSGKDFVGKIGIIAPVTRPFCGSCSRLRLSAKGELRPCLFSTENIDLLQIIRKGFQSDSIEWKLREAFHEVVGRKPFSEQTYAGHKDVCIRSIGG